MPHAKRLIPIILKLPLSQTVVDALMGISAHCPLLSAIIETQIYLKLSVILSDASSNMRAAHADAKSSPPAVTQRLRLSLESLAKLKHSPPDRFRSCVELALHFVDHPNPHVRCQATVTVCRLYDKPALASTAGQTTQVSTPSTSLSSSDRLVRRVWKWMSVYVWMWSGCVYSLVLFIIVKCIFLYASHVYISPCISHRITQVHTALQRLLSLGVADSHVNIRRTIFDNLHGLFDAYLSESSHLRYVCVCVCV
jgi:hypothetical protein